LGGEGARRAGKKGQGTGGAPRDQTPVTKGKNEPLKGGWFVKKNERREVEWGCLEKCKWCISSPKTPVGKKGKIRTRKSRDLGGGGLDEGWIWPRGKGADKAEDSVPAFFGTEREMGERRVRRGENKVVNSSRKRVEGIRSSMREGRQGGPIANNLAEKTISGGKKTKKPEGSEKKERKKKKKGGWARLASNMGSKYRLDFFAERRNRRTKTEVFRANKRPGGYNIGFCKKEKRGEGNGRQYGKKKARSL